MNERIKELAKDAGADIWGDKVAASQYFDIEKFAELLIGKCISKVAEWDMGINHPVGATDNTSMVARNMVAEIKQYFGVKE